MKLSKQQIERLDNLGFIWDASEARWNENFAALQVFVAENGHDRVPQKHKSGELSLGIWIGGLRQRYREAGLNN